MEPTFDKIYGMDYPTFFKLIDNMYDEIYIVDNNYKLIYVNKACSRHYGATQEEMIGKTSWDFDREKWWEPSFLTPMYKDKKAYIARQKIYNGLEVISIAVPIFDENDNIQFVVMNVRDDISEYDLYNKRIDLTPPAPLVDGYDLIQKSDALREVIELATRISRIDATCIITGETGVGKTLLAKHMHKVGSRSDKPFISLNCASLPSELLESELFGYAKGAFTGANQTGKKGFLELATGGTLLLDEISELPLSAQAKILHVVQDQEFFPIGATEPVKVNVKIIAATNKSLEDLVSTGHFREDLFYRLDVVDIYIPPLRRRREDIPYLVYHFLSEFSKKYGLNRQITDEAMNILINNEWKGNVRELKHVVERMVVTSDTPVIDVNQLPKSLFGIIDQKSPYISDEGTAFDEKVEAYERFLIKQAVEKFGSSRKVADHLKLSQTKANTLIRKYTKVE